MPETTKRENFLFYAKKKNNPPHNSGSLYKGCKNQQKELPMSETGTL
jgi:hypothetical protein